MKKIHFIVLIAGIFLFSLAGIQLASAQDKTFYVGNPMDFSKIYTFLSKIWEQGVRDYYAVINQQGGVKGYKLELLIEDHANEPQRMIEIYERMKKQGAMIINTWSTPAALSILPRCTKDKIILYTPFHGRGDAVFGEVFPWVFPLAASYWSKAAAIVDYIHQQEKENLKGKKIAYVFIDTPFGHEVQPVLKRLSEKLGYELSLFGYSPPGNEQSSIWTQVRRFRPDWVILWGAGIGQSVAVKEAARNGIPTNRITSCDWMNEPDVKLIGLEQAKGVIRVESASPGRNFPIIRDILKELYAQGKGHGDEKIVGTSLYNVAVSLSTIISEAIKIAVDKFDEPLDSEKLRKALESFEKFNCGGLTAPLTTSPQDHEGGGGCRLSQWDGQKFAPLTDWFVTRYRDIVLEVAQESAAKYKARAEGK
jgi:branched-chain amino acid transport system substrate-binding protein